MLKQQPGLLHSADENGWTLLHETTRAGNVESVSIVLELIDNVLDVNARTGPDKNGQNALDLAMKYGCHSIAKLLQSSGTIDVDASDRSEL
jgi:ankyrin repeat protein